METRSSPWSCHPACTKRTTESGAPDWPAVYPLPRISIQPPGVAGPQTYGLWNNVRAAAAKPARALLASG